MNNDPAMHNIGCLLGQRLVSALCGNGIEYNKLVEIVYGELASINSEMIPGDWITMPNGASFTKN